MEKKLKKMLSPEEVTELKNAMSILEQLLQLSDTENDEEEMLEEEMNDEEKEQEEDIEKEGEGSASDDAEERIDDATPESSKDGIEEVSKTLARIVRNIEKKTQPIKKSKGIAADKQIIKAIGSIANVVHTVAKQNSSLVKEQKEMQESLSSILDGIGISENIEKSYNTHAQKSKRPVTVNKDETDAILKALKKALLDKKGESDTEEFDAHKEMVGIMPSLLKKR